MFGCDRLAAACASRLNRSTNVRSIESSGKQDLDSYRPVQKAIMGAVNLGHAAAGDQVNELVAARQHAWRWSPCVSNPTSSIPQACLASGRRTQFARRTRSITSVMLHHEIPEHCVTIGPRLWLRLRLCLIGHDHCDRDLWMAGRREGDHPVVGHVLPTRLSGAGLRRHLPDGGKIPYAVPDCDTTPCMRPRPTERSVAKSPGPMASACRSRPHCLWDRGFRS